MNVNGLPYHKGERVIDITAERDSLRAENARLREALDKIANVSGMSAATHAKSCARAALAARGAE